MHASYPRKPLLSAALAAAFAATVATPASGAVTYSRDDGTSEIPFVVSVLPATFGNHFTVIPGGQTIGTISIAWTGPNGGRPIVAKLWSDPNGDGNPSDASLLSSVAGLTINGSATGTFETYDIPDVTLAIGQSFFVGATVPGPLAVVVGTDTSAVDGESWIAFPAADFGPTPAPVRLILQDLMVRANAVAEPGSLILLGLALAGLGLTRRRVKF